MRLPPRWVVVVSLAVAAAILGDSVLYAVLPTIHDELGIGAAAVGLLLSANRLVRLISNPIAGWVMARFGARWPFTLAIFLGALTTLIYGLNVGIVIFVLARAGWGIAWSFLRLGGYLAALDASDDGSRGYYLGFFNGVTRFGSTVSVLVGALLTDLVGFRETILIFTGISLLGGLAVLRERPPEPKVAIAPQATSGGGVRELFVNLHGITLVLYVLAFLQALTINGLVTSTLGAWLEDQFGSQIDLLWLTVGVASLTGILLGVRFLSDFLWGPLSGHLSDRHGRRLVLGIAGAIQVSALVLLAIGGNIWLTIGVTLALFLAATAVAVTIDALAGDLAPKEQRSQAMSWYAMFHDLGAAAGPLIGWAGISLGLMYPIAGVLVLLAGVVFIAAFTVNERGRLQIMAADD